MSRVTQATAPSVTVLTPVKNCEKYLSAALNSIRDQTLTSWNCIVADNGSSDRSLEIAREFQMNDSRFSVISLPGIKLPEIRNRLLEEASTELVAWLDADDIAEPSRLEKQHDFMNNNLECAVIGTFVSVIDPDARRICRKIMPRYHNDILREIVTRKGIGVSFPSTMMRKSLIQKSDGFCMEFGVAEDVDLILRLAEYGTIENLEQPLTRYRWRLDNLSWTQPGQCEAGARKAIRDAICRGQFDSSVIKNFPDLPEFEGKGASSIYTQWANTAFYAREFRVAAVHAWKAIMESPVNSKAWQILGEAVFPLHDSHGVYKRPDNLPMRLAASFFRRICLAIAWLVSKYTANQNDADRLKAGGQDV